MISPFLTVAGPLPQELGCEGKIRVRRNQIRAWAHIGSPVVGLVKTGGGAAISTRTKMALILVLQRAIPLKSSANVRANGARCRNDQGGIPVASLGIAPLRPPVRH